MKLSKKILALIMTIMCLINLVQIPCKVNAKEVTGGQKLKKVVEKQEKKKAHYVKENEKREKEFGKIQEVVVVNKEKEIYVESYGGAYCNKDNKIVIQTTNKNSKDINKIIEEVDEEIIIEEVDYSYNELKEEYNNISEQFSTLVDKESRKKMDSNLENLTENMNGVSIDVEKNKVVVYLKEITDQSKKQFEEYYNVENVIFKEAEPAKMEATLVKLGQAIYTTSSRGSVGMKAYYINSAGKKVKGFVTAGHMGVVGDSIYINGCSNTKIGKITKRQLSGSLDAAFVKITNDSYAPSRKVYYSDSKGTVSDKYTLDSYSYLSDTYVGAYLYKAGSTTYLTKGKVISTSSTIRLSDIDVVLTDLWEVNYVSAPGDSGGAVFDVEGNCIAGIHVAGGTYRYAVKWENITNEWNLYEY